jgi:hypothetical protein
MKLGVSVQREYSGPTGEVPGVAFLITTNLNEKDVTNFFEGAKRATVDEWERLGKPSPNPPLVQLWLYLNE